MRVCIVTEFYPRAYDPVLGIWAHEQAKAARDAGAEVKVVVLHRPVPPLSTPPRRMPGELRDMLAQPRRATLDDIDVRYVPFVAPPRPRGYGSWGAWAAPSLALALRRLRREWRFDLVHAHNAVPAGEAVRRARVDVPLVVSLHGADVFFTAPRYPAGAAAVRATLAGARLVLANSEGIERAGRALGAHDTRILRLGTDVPHSAAAPSADPTVATVAHLVARKRHADVLRAIWVLRERHPRLRYLVIGGGPERAALEALSRELGLAERVEFTGQLPRPEALERARTAHLFAMPSVDEAFGVAYIEAMAAGVPVIGSLGEPGPQEIASAGGGIELVPPADVEVLAKAIDRLLSDHEALRSAGARARQTVLRTFTWEQCGQATVTAYADALR